MSIWQEWKSYRRFQQLPPGDRSIVFYSETHQDWHHLQPLIDFLTERLSRTVCHVTSEPGVALPAERPGCAYAWHLFSIRVAARDGLAAHLGANGIATSFHYTKPIHLQPALAALGGGPGDLPVSERLCREVMQVPLFPETSGQQVSRVADAIRSFCASALARA